MTVTVLGAGSWGTALAILLARNDLEVTLYGRDDEDLRAMASVRENMAYLPGFVLPKNIRVTWEEETLTESDFWVVAVPSGAVRSVLPLIPGEHPVVTIASKGIEAGTAMLLKDVAAEVLPDAEIGVISGPNLAVEIVRGVPTVAVCAFAKPELADMVRGAFMARSFRVYTGTDIIGIEVAGALKNVLAIGAGMSDSLGFGDNTKGAFLARGLHETAKMGLALGGRLETFLGIAGVGDLFATASSRLSRNYRLGSLIGGGIPLREAQEQIGQVAEGVSTSESVQILARKHEVPMPTFEAVEAVLRGRIAPMAAVNMLMERLPKSEITL
jgi:glycerol-3-phosphate dehydrogenase (NAD(P)+)